MCYSPCTRLLSVPHRLFRYNILRPETLYLYVAAGTIAQVRVFRLLFPKTSCYFSPRNHSFSISLTFSVFSKRWSQLVHLSRRNGHTRMCVQVVQRIDYILWFVCFSLYKHFFLSYIRQRL